MFPQCDGSSICSSLKLLCKLLGSCWLAVINDDESCGTPSSLDCTFWCLTDFCRNASILPDSTGFHQILIVNTNVCIYTNFCSLSVPLSLSWYVLPFWGQISHNTVIVAPSLTFLNVLKSSSNRFRKPQFRATTWFQSSICSVQCSRMIVTYLQGKSGFLEADNTTRSWYY